jgi:hypothetical protein
MPEILETARSYIVFVLYKFAASRSCFRWPALYLCLFRQATSQTACSRTLRRHERYRSSPKRRSSKFDAALDGCQVS